MKERHLFRRSAAMEYKKPKLEFEERQPLGPNEKFALIEIVRSFPEIWDEHNPAFKDSARKTQLWHMVRREMEGVHSREFQDLELQRAWKNLRDSYRRKRKEIQEFVARSSGSAASACVAIKKKSWPFYEAMEYMDSVIDQGCGTRVHRLKRKLSSGAESPELTVKNGCECGDSFDTLGAMLAVRLRELDELDVLAAEEFMYKINSLQLEISRKLLDIKRRGR